MSKRATRKQVKQVIGIKSRRRVLITAGLVIVLIATSALAFWGNSFSTAQKNAKQAATASLDPQNPAKEYIYAGSRLIATEEPTSQTIANNSGFISQSVPASMTSGQSYSVSVTMSNTGMTTWATGSYFLGSQNPQANTTWGVSQVPLASNISPGRQTTFTFNAVAPASAGTYNFQWQMLQSGVGYFGAASLNVVVTVSATVCSGATACPTVSTYSGPSTGVAGYKEGTPSVALWRAPAAAVTGKDPTTLQETMYVADTDNHCIRKINLSNQPSGLVAGTPNSAGYFDPPGNVSATSAKYNFPRGIAAIKDANGIVTTLIVADTDNHLLRKLQWVTNKWVSSTLSGTPGEPGLRDGDATFSVYNAPQGITYASDGFLHIADTENRAVRKVDLLGNSITVVAPGVINRPAGISARQSNGAVPLLYISGQGDHNIYKWDPTNGVALLAGTGLPGGINGTGTAASFSSPGQLAWACSSNGEVLYIADRINGRIRLLTLSTLAVTNYAGTKEGFVNGTCAAAKFFMPTGIAVGPGSEVYIMDKMNNVIRKAQ